MSATLTDQMTQRIKDLEARIHSMERNAPHSFQRLENAVIDVMQSARVQAAILEHASRIAANGIDLAEISRATTARLDANMDQHVTRTLRERFSGLNNLVTLEMLRGYTTEVNGLSNRLSSVEIQAEELRSASSRQHTALETIRRSLPPR